ncbi:MAG: hypothetical protein WBB89_01510, partial [Candidatus Acidiferrum sp.]
LSSRAPGRTLSIQIRQALLLGLAFNLYRLRHPSQGEDVNRAITDYKLDYITDYKDVIGLRRNVE